MKLRTVNSIKRHNSMMFKSALGYDLNYDNPRTFNEKLNWLKFNYRDPLMSECSGKDTVRSFICRTLGEDDSVNYLTKFEGGGVYSHSSEIDFDSLPSQFVLKLNNGSGQNIICTDKSKLSIKDTIDTLDKWLSPEFNHYYNFYEWGYKNTTSTIVCEEFLGDWGSVRDYKFFCFNGEPRFVYVSNEFDSEKKHIDMDYLNLDWSPTGYVRKSYKPPASPFDKPRHLDLMIDLSRRLSGPFPFVRVDFFEVDDILKIAELTFYPAAGYGAFEDISQDREIGDMLFLPNKLRAARLISLGEYR